MSAQLLYGEDEQADEEDHRDRLDLAGQPWREGQLHQIGQASPQSRHPFAALTEIFQKCLRLRHLPARDRHNTVKFAV